jgi:hypothetical protein
MRPFVSYADWPYDIPPMSITAIESGMKTRKELLEVFFDFFEFWEFWEFRAATNAWDKNFRLYYGHPMRVDELPEALAKGRVALCSAIPGAWLPRPSIQFPT